MASVPKVLIIDDDHDAAAWLAYQLRSRFPEMQIVTRTAPNVSGTFDIYFIDNDFHGTCLAADLSMAIRAMKPSALIVAFSGRLDNHTLKRILNAGCDGAFEKGDPEEIDGLCAIVSAYLDRNDHHQRQPAEWGFMGALRAIQGLLREWNQRLDSNPWAGTPVASGRA